MWLSLLLLGIVAGVHGMARRVDFNQRVLEDERRLIDDVNQLMGRSQQGPTTSSPYWMNGQPVPTTRTPYRTYRRPVPTTGTPYRTYRRPVPTTRTPYRTYKRPVPTTITLYRTYRRPVPTTRTHYWINRRPVPTRRSHMREYTPSTLAQLIIQQQRNDWLQNHQNNMRNSVVRRNMTSSTNVFVRYVCRNGVCIRHYNAGFYSTVSAGGLFVLLVLAACIAVFAVRRRRAVAQFSVMSDADFRPLIDSGSGVSVGRGLSIRSDPVVLARI